jgi:hypothetical protein
MKRWTRIAPRSGLLAAALAAALVLAGAEAEAANFSPPIPGGRYAGKTLGGAPIRVGVAANMRNGVARGWVASCGRAARFKSTDGSWVATRRNRAGRVLFRAVGSFAAANRVSGRVTRLRHRRGMPRRAARHCHAARFRAPLKLPAHVRAKTVRYGPYAVPPGGKNEFRAKIEKPCDDCYLVGMVPGLEGADGSPANFDTMAMLHHAVFTSLGVPDQSCPGMPQRFFASGNERTPFVLPRGYGYRVQPGDRWGILTHLMNMRPQNQAEYVTVTFYYIEAPAHLKPVTPLWLDVDNCSDSEYSIPAGFSDTRWDFTVPPGLGGKVVAMGGHIHDDGIRIRATDETRGTMLCDSRAGYGQVPSYRGHIESMTGCTGKPLGRIGAGDVLRLHSIYDSPTPQNDVMGIMLAYIAQG